MATCRPRILVLDEDPLALELYSRELSSEYDVITSENVRESLGYLENVKLDVLVIEPATNRDEGWEFLNRIAAMEDPPGVILCSVQDDRAAGLRQGVDLFLVKPVLPVTLHGLVNQIVARRLNHATKRLDQDS